MKKYSAFPTTITAKLLCGTPATANSGTVVAAAPLVSWPAVSGNLPSLRPIWEQDELEAKDSPFADRGFFGHSSSPQIFDNVLGSDSSLLSSTQFDFDSSDFSWTCHFTKLTSSASSVGGDSESNLSSREQPECRHRTVYPRTVPSPVATSEPLTEVQSASIAAPAARLVSLKIGLKKSLATLKSRFDATTGQGNLNTVPNCGSSQDEIANDNGVPSDRVTEGCPVPRGIFCLKGPTESCSGDSNCSTRFCPSVLSDELFHERLDSSTGTPSLLTVTSDKFYPLKAASSGERAASCDRSPGRLAFVPGRLPSRQDV